MPHHSAEVPTSLDLAERGVYVLPFVGRGGERYVVAVNRLRQRVLEATVLPDMPVDAVTDMLWALLDREDPAPGPPLVLVN